MRLKAISFCILLFSATVAYGRDQELWEQYKHNFISSDGRVIDNHQGMISHSEGQGYGMRLSLLHDDTPTFDWIWRWTKNNLMVRSDGLIAWQWGKRPNGDWKVIDYNDATDGDLLVAYALLTADAKWHDAGYRSAALKILRDVRTGLSITWDGHTFLLPGYHGFSHENGFEINTSYLILPAFRLFAQEDQRAFWEKAYQDALYLIEHSCFGKMRLPADWVYVTDGRVSISSGRNPYFGSEAIRVVLHLASEKKAKFPAGVGKILDLYKQIGYLPLWVDLEKDSFSLTPAPAGYYAVYALAAKQMGDAALGKQLQHEAREKLNSGGENSYYSFSLYLLAAGEESEAVH